MNPETFFEKFELFADAPNTVAQMRAFILELAVQGKLVEQIAAEGDGQTLLASIREKNEAVDEDLADTDSEAADYPNTWAPARLGEVAQIIRGVTFPGSAKSTEKANGDVACLRTASVQAEIDWDDMIYISPSHVSRDDQWIERNDIMISMANSYDLVGKVAIVRSVPQKATFGAFLAAIRPIGIDAFFLLYVLRSPGMQAAFRSSSSQTTNIANISLGRMRPLPFPVPPLAEQKRIVAKVDELMALCDRLEAQQQERDTRHATLARASLARFAADPTPANLQFLFHRAYYITPSDLRKSILTLAVQGKLVPQVPNDEPADVLFEKIQVERAQKEAEGAYKSVKSLPPIEEIEEPIKLPTLWKWARLRSLVFILGDGLHGTPEYSDGTDCYFINGNNLVDGRIVIKPHTKTVSVDEAKKHRKPMTLSTVLVSINGTLGSVAFYNNENIILGKSACYFNVASLVDKHFVRRVIESPYFINYASENATGTTIRNLGLKAMNHFPFPLPPLAEQRRIVAKVDELMALVDQLEAQLTTSRATAAKLMEAVVAELTSVNSGPHAVEPQHA